MKEEKEEDDDSVDDDDDDHKVYLLFSRLSFDTGNIDASADGVNINTILNLIRDDEGRLKINNITCDAKINRMRAKFSGTLGYNVVINHDY